jgi:hypothetical protein
MNFSPLAVISGGQVGSLLIQLVVAGLIFWLVLWFIDWVGLPEPFAKVAKVIIGIVVLIFLINVLLGLSGSGHQFIAW